MYLIIIDKLKKKSTQLTSSEQVLSNWFGKLLNKTEIPK